MSEWKTIDSAEKTWVHIDLWTDSHGRMANCFWSRGFWVTCGGFRVDNPTHWMPLPSPPKEELR